MAEDKVQLKREEIVGNDVVLQDINPKTSTNSITDSSKGIPLDQTLARIWNAINNKLSRVVNSVNGRTGVVVIDADTVGLGNVDNVSFGDIKQWVIERLEQEFNTKRIQIYEYLDELDALINENDEAYKDTAFFSRWGNRAANDMRSYIGYIYWDPSENKLKVFSKTINVVGYTDRSLIYNVDANNDEVTGKNFLWGGLAVNIYKYEDALKVYNNLGGNGDFYGEHSSDVLRESGLYIDKSNIAPKLYFFDGVYGNGNPGDSNALLYYDNSYSSTVDPKQVEIYLNGQRLVPGSTPIYIRQKFKIYDLIMTNFNDEGYHTGENGTYPDGMISSLMYRCSAIGQVTQAPDKKNPNVNYVINFYSLKPNVDFGLTYHDTNYDSGNKIGDKVLGINPLMAYNGNERSYNISGINAMRRINSIDRDMITERDRYVSTILPTGRFDETFPSTDAAYSDSGVYISPNFSLCIIPHSMYGDPKNRPIPNWPIHEGCVVGGPNGGQLPPSSLSVNLLKKVNEDGKAVNMSGLRVIGDDQPLFNFWLGFGDDDESALEIRADVKQHSGGLSINVGNFLDIGGNDDIRNPLSGEGFYDSGKLNVRIDKNAGLYNAGYNRIGVRLSRITQTYGTFDNAYPGGGLEFVGNPDHSSTLGIAVKRGLGLRLTYHNSSMELGSHPDSLSVAIADTLLCEREFELIDGTGIYDVKTLYGGLRFFSTGDDAKSISTLAIRVNNSEGLSNERKGSQGLRITDENVLGVQTGKGVKIDEEGNLTAAIGGGLTFVEGDITIKTGDGLEIDEDGALNVSNPIKSVNVLRITDSFGYEFVYRPLDGVEEEVTIDLNLGKGLKLERSAYTESDPEEETPGEDESEPEEGNHDNDDDEEHGEGNADGSDEDTVDGDDESDDAGSEEGEESASSHDEEGSS